MAIRIKVCGIATFQSASHALKVGADFLGINRYQGSPRCVSQSAARELMQNIPQGKRVVVDVAPSLDTLKEHLEEGFDYFQLHFDYIDAQSLLPKWRRLIGKERLWLAPRLNKGDAFPSALLEYADTLLLDACDAEGYGGSGLLADWPLFRDLQDAHPEKVWILAGGLGPGNVKRAIAESGARFIDVNSRVETSPGVKDLSLLKTVFESVRSIDD
ncbi:MAG: phosphoribosylanthranilate isomerase [Opitutales bacterium]